MKEDKQRKFHDALLHMLYPPPPSPPPHQEDDGKEEEANNLAALLADLPEEEELDDEDNCSVPSSGTDEKLTRAQRKRLRKRKLKEATSQRRAIIGPLLPGSEGGNERIGGEVEVVNNEAEGVRRNAATNEPLLPGSEDGNERVGGGVEDVNNEAEGVRRNAATNEPLLPGSEGGNERIGGGFEVVNNEAEGVRRNAATNVSGDSKNNKVKRRRKSKKLAVAKLVSSITESVTCDQNQDLLGWHSHGLFVDYCIWGWDNLPRTVLMYYANFISSPEGYFHTVVCNAPAFRNTIVNSDLHFISWDNPPKQHPHYLTGEDMQRMVDSNAPFARKFRRDDPILDKIDSELLFKGKNMLVPGGWCIGSSENRTDPCSEVGNVTVLRPSAGAKRLENLTTFLLSDNNFRPQQCK